MNRLATLICTSSLALGVGGCGPMQSPMPPRLNDEDQKAIDDSWEKALAPVGRFDNQALLDLFIATNAYQVGVDRLELRSEKRFSGGLVVMEIYCDRLAPEKDRFEVKVLDREGGVVRKERYNREQAERTQKELLVDHDVLRRKRDQGAASPEELKKLEGYEARLAAINQVFPKREAGGDGQGDAGKRPEGK